MPEMFELVNAVNAMTKALVWLSEVIAKREIDTFEEILPAEPETAKPEPKVTPEEVRSKLAQKSRSGMQKEVKALIQKYGGEKFSDLPESVYPELLKELDGLHLKADCPERISAGARVAI